MKLLSTDVLSEYGFTEKEDKTGEGLKVLTNGKMDIVIKSDGLFYYHNMGFYYPLKDLASLRKLYKEVKNEDLKPV